MAFISWSEDLTTTVDKMDREHQELIRLMNVLYDKNDNGAPRDELLSAVATLANYTKKHFTEEEQYMESIDYPKLVMHKAIHHDLLTKFQQHADAFASGGDRIPPEFFNFLKLWLSAHIKGIDRQYGDFSQSKAA